MNIIRKPIPAATMGAALPRTSGGQFDAARAATLPEMQK